MGLLWLKIIFMLMITNWLSILVTFFVLGCMVFIVLWVLHPDNKSMYESYASIPLEDVIDGEDSHQLPSKTRFSIFM